MINSYSIEINNATRNRGICVVIGSTKTKKIGSKRESDKEIRVYTVLRNMFLVIANFFTKNNLRRPRGMLDWTLKLILNVLKKMVLVQVSTLNVPTPNRSRRRRIQHRDRLAKFPKVSTLAKRRGKIGKSTARMVIDVKNKHTRPVRCNIWFLHQMEDRLLLLKDFLSSSSTTISVDLGLSSRRNTLAIEKYGQQAWRQQQYSEQTRSSEYSVIENKSASQFNEKSIELSLRSLYTSFKRFQHK